MPSETPSQISPAVLIYIAMGAVTAKILFEGDNPRNKTWLGWLQFLVRAGSIVLLWPLVLFLEKFEIWLKTSEQEKK
jgi:hypothetical protein